MDLAAQQAQLPRRIVKVSFRSIAVLPVTKCDQLINALILDLAKSLVVITDLVVDPRLQETQRLLLEPGKTIVTLVVMLDIVEISTCV